MNLEDTWNVNVADPVETSRSVKRDLVSKVTGPALAGHAHRAICWGGNKEHDESPKYY